MVPEWGLCSNSWLKITYEALQVFSGGGEVFVCFCLFFMNLRKQGTIVMEYQNKP